MTHSPADSLPPMPSTWVDRLRMIPHYGIGSGPDWDCADAGAGAPCDTATTEFNIVSLNMLAESYLTPRSHPGLPDSYASIAFNSFKRRKLLVDTLEKFCDPEYNITVVERTYNKWDIIAIQELDLHKPGDPILPAFKKWGYQVVHTPNDTRNDCCAIAFDTNKFTLVESEVVRFDDLATLLHSTDTENIDRTSSIKHSTNTVYCEQLKTDSCNEKSIKTSSTSPELRGLVRSFLRRNCAIVAHLKSIDTMESFIVASVHLYWNPEFEYVKLCQAKYLLDKVARFASTAPIRGQAVESGIECEMIDGTIRLTPTIICGDMNSKPGSVVHGLFTKPHVDARTVAPWNYFWDPDEETMYKEETNDLCDQINEPNLPVPRNSDPSNGRRIVGHSDDDEANGKCMEELPSKFEMYCGITDDRNDSGTRNQTQETTSTSQKQNDNYIEKQDESDGGYDDLRSSLQTWNGLHRKMVASGQVPQLEITNDATLFDDDGLKASVAWSKLHQRNTPQDYEHSLPPLRIKYMLDYTLNRFTRWLRILGIDAALETLDEEKERTSGGNIAIFKKCRSERRTLITTSYKLLLRKDCPPGAYLLDPKSTPDLEKALPRLLRTHGVELLPRVFLTRCVVCSGHIGRVFADEEKRAIFTDHGAPNLLDSKEEVEVFRCSGCKQGYWWDDRPSSSASRVFSQATKLLRICLRGGVALKNEAISDEKTRRAIMGAFDFVDVAKERQKPENTVNEIRELSVIGWLREEKLCSCFHLRSAYALGDLYAESLPFTNVTRDFVGCLDYVFFQQSEFDLMCTLNVPTSFKTLNSSGIQNGHLIPSDIWPSDHIAVGARLRLKRSKNVVYAREKKEPADMILPSTDVGNGIDVIEAKHHAPRCMCGCVPPVLSLFEMAELRKKAKEKQEIVQAKLSGNI